jgi:cyclopropane-fatty-acyl-phospholipid synthase
MLLRKLIDELIARTHREDIPLRLSLLRSGTIDLGRDPKVTLTARSLRGVRQIVAPTLDGLGRAYVEGDLDVEGALPDIIDVAVQLAAHAPPGAAPAPARNAHSRELDREAIAYHYDVSNDFYGLWLDRERVYSCAYFRREDDDLDRAQLQKLDHILRKLQLRPGQRLLDIGCGWGALIRRAAAQYGARAVGITLSEQQFEYARARIDTEGLGDRCEVRLQDYRDVRGTFDRIASVGMFEHVGLANLETYFRCIHDLLDDDGVALNHGITSGDCESRGAPLGAGEFIERYVFPHGELPHLGLALKNLCAAGLEPVDVECLRRHYTRTLQHWAQRLEAGAERARALVGERLFRIWRVYLAGCAYGFSHHWVSIHQILAVKADRPNPLPLTRDYMYAGT